MKLWNGLLLSCATPVASMNLMLSRFYNVPRASLVRLILLAGLFGY